MSTAADARRRELAQIHLAAKQLGMDDDNYRAMLWSVARVRSAKDLDAGGRRAVIDHLKAVGFRPRRKGRTSVGENKQQLAAKVRAQLQAAGKPEGYADGMARKMFEVERWEWCSPDQLRRLIAALNYQARREAR
ncbi:regulatory protein GemA [Arhodomonas aquaeolei]|uniref:gp16 family protein n=1 Tax=Arhodomonas aquaeolei TaxID=2369 RepID=UPI002167AF9B|nr:regulatory protein GemA [Arhodomonas aquaeolei]MCS4503870.1 regulatory protein GemA [Arhodomonas aquaeolei]